MAECSSSDQRDLSRTSFTLIWGSVLQYRCYCLIVNLPVAPQSSSIWRIYLKFILRGQKNVPRLQFTAHQAWRAVWWFINLSLPKQCTFLSNICFQGMSNNKGKLERKKNEEDAGWEKNWGLNMIPIFPVSKLYLYPAFLCFSWLRQLWSSRGFSDHPTCGQVPTGLIWNIANPSLDISPTWIPSSYGKIEMQGTISTAIPCVPRCWGWMSQHAGDAMLGFIRRTVLGVMTCKWLQGSHSIIAWDPFFSPTSGH